MGNLKGEKIYLRALEKTDLDFLYKVENDEAVWEVSNTIVPFSRHVLAQYLENAHRDIFEVKQLRLVICKNEDGSALGLIDLYDFEPLHRRVGVGIILYAETERQKGYSFQALQLVCNYAFQNLKMHQIFANITEDNTNSIRLFEKAGFEKTAVKQDWVHTSEGYKNEVLFQLISNVH